MTKMTVQQTAIETLDSQLSETMNLMATAIGEVLKGDKAGAAADLVEASERVAFMRTLLNKMVESSVKEQQVSGASRVDPVDVF